MSRTRNMADLLDSSGDIKSGRFDNLTTDVVGDTTPQLGGNLDLNSSDITGTGNVNITGNVTLSGTVDGRDVATDGTKLDGIEASATADQTDAEIKTAYENNSDTNAFTDALQTKLNGIEASADVTDTTNVVAALTAGAAISIAGDGTIAYTGSTDVVGDTTPQLGGDLDTNGNAILFGSSKWSIELDTGDNDLLFKYNGTTVFKLASNGAVTSANDVTAFGTP